jgi:Zn-finger nucleic acid-binding protein
VGALAEARPNWEVRPGNPVRRLLAPSSSVDRKFGICGRPRSTLSVKHVRNRTLLTQTKFMQSPLHPEATMKLREVEPGLDVYECPISGGIWIPLQSYLEWKGRREPTAREVPTDSKVTLADETRHHAMICPESGRLLIRYRVGHGLPFHLDRSPATGGVWLDRGEWEALKTKGLHVQLHLIFTSSYQREIRSTEYMERLQEDFRGRIGSADFPKVAEFAGWLVNHPKRRDICCFLVDCVEHKPHGGASAD